MSHGIHLNGPQHLLTNGPRLQSLRAHLADIVSDLDELLGKPEAERTADQAGRDSVLRKLDRLTDL